MPVLAPIDPSSPAAVALTRERQRGDAVGDKLAATRKHLAGRVVGARTATDATIARVRHTVLIVGGCALLVLLGVAFVVTRSIVRPLAAICEVLRCQHPTTGRRTVPLGDRRRPTRGELQSGISAAGRR